MTIGEGAMKTGAEERMEIMADEVALEGGADFEAEEVFEGVSGVVEEGMVEGGKMNYSLWRGDWGASLFKQSDVNLFVYTKHFFTLTGYFREPIDALLHVPQGSTMFHRLSVSTFTEQTRILSSVTNA